MNKPVYIKNLTRCIPALLLAAVLTTTAMRAQEPDLSKLQPGKEQINAWLAYCEYLKSNSSWMGSGANTNPGGLQKASLKGLQLTPAGDAADRSRFFYYAAFGYYTQMQMKTDSVQYYFYRSLEEAQKANSALLVEKACIALMHMNFEMEEPAKTDSCKKILQSIIDTAKDKILLLDGYSALGSYYQQKSYYSTAQDYFIKSIELRKQQLDTAKDTKSKLDYANKCYTLSKLYTKTDMTDKALAMLYEGQRFASLSPLVDIRYKGFFTELFSKKGVIDSALYYLQHYIQPLEEHFKNNPSVPAEIVFANLGIAQYYIDRRQYDKALPYLDKAFTQAARGKEVAFIYETQILMGRYLQETGKPAQAVSLLLQALPAAKQFSKEDYANALKYMALAQQGNGNTGASLQYYTQYVQQQDSLTKEKISRTFADLETHYQTSEKEQRIVSLDKENRLNALQLQDASRTRLFLVLGLAALGTIALLLYFIYRNKEKVNRVLNTQNEKLGELNTALAAANETKVKLLGIIGHDLRSPISRVVQLLQLQKETPSLLNAETQLKHEQQLKTASEHLLETMEDLLLWSKSQMQHFTPQYRRTALAAIVQKEVDFLQQPAADKNISLRQQVSNHFIQNTDENFLAVIIRNLLQNAVKYCPADNIISITNDDQKLFITNAAVNADAEVFNAFLLNRQVDSKNSGMGLQIARDLAASIHVKIFFTCPDARHLSAVLSWEE